MSHIVSESPFIHTISFTTGTLPDLCDFPKPISGESHRIATTYIERKSGSAVNCGLRLVKGDISVLLATISLPSAGATKYNTYDISYTEDYFLRFDFSGHSAGERYQILISGYIYKP